MKYHKKGSFEYSLLCSFVEPVDWYCYPIINFLVEVVVDVKCKWTMYLVLGE